MNPLAPFYQKHAEALFSTFSDRGADMERKHLEKLIDSLRAFSVLFKLLPSVDDRCLPETCHKKSMLQLLDRAEGAGDLFMQAETLEKNAEASGMDLEYLHQYALQLARQNLDELKTYKAEFDIGYWKEYGEWFIESVRGDDPNEVIQKVQVCTLDKVRKSLKRLKRLKKKNPNAGNFFKLRRKLIALGFLLEILHHETPHYGDLQERLAEDAHSLEMWYSRWVALRIIGNYKRDHPELACRYNGTLEILNDYMQQKIKAV